MKGTGWFAAPNWIFDADLTAFERLVYLYLCRRSGPDGGSWPSLTRIAEDCGISVSSVQRALGGLEDKGCLVKQQRIDPATGSQKSNMYSIFTAPLPSRPTPLISEGTPPCSSGPPPILSETNEVLPSELDPEEGHIVGPTGPTTPSPSKDKDSEPYRLAQHLREVILARDPATKVPPDDPARLKAWVREADRMLRIDKRDPREAARLMVWAQRDSFWSTNILSMGAFRKQYDKLKRQAQIDTGVGQQYAPDISPKASELSAEERRRVEWMGKTAQAQRERMAGGKNDADRLRSGTTNDCDMPIVPR